MHIAGSHHKLVKFFPKFADPAVDILQFFHRIHRLFVTAQHELIVSKRLYLQIIIELYKSYDLFLRSSAHNRTV